MILKKKNDIYPYKLSIVVPVFNEEKNFHRGVLNSFKNFLYKQKYKWEVLFINDGSLDNTPKLLRKFSNKNSNIKLVNIPHGGKAMAVSKGIVEAKGEIILFTDFDQSTPINEVTKVLLEFERGADLVIGTRTDEVNRPILQNLRSKVFNLLVQLIVLPGIKDSQCGFKAFKNSIGKKLFSSLKITNKRAKGSYMGAFDVEVLLLARKKNYKIGSIPVKWQAIKSDKLTIMEPLKMLIDLIKLRLSYLF